MDDSDLKKYCNHALDGGATHAVPISPSTVVTAPWVRMKCQFECAGYGRRYGCPPDTPTPEQTQAVIDCYHRAILFHLKAPEIPNESRRKSRNQCYDMLVALEGELFKDGYYKAFVFLAGPCHLCRECGKMKGKPCQFGYKSRPSMEACGMDVYETARNNGFHIQPLRKKEETQNIYSLMLVD
ncbi:MAG: DUF2284 domain-containing protein [Deltaproteobacteria bacterium]|nr:DUF2284 domain-containing protein [Deltaproteobacteria bacterium]